MDQVDALLKATPDQLSALTAKAGLLVFEGEWEQAEATCVRVFSIDPRSARCHFVIGLARQREKRFKEAWESLDRAYQSNPRFWEPLFQQGTIALEAGDFVAAVEKFGQVVKLSPSPQAFDSLGVASVRMGDFAKAVDAFQTALRIDPSFLPARRNLALALQKRQ